MIGGAWDRVGIRGRLAVAYSLVLVVLLGVLAAYFYSGARSTLESARLAELRSAASLMARELLDPPVTDEILDAAVRRLANPGLAVFVFDRPGTLVARAGWPGQPVDAWRDLARLGGLGGDGFVDTQDGRAGWAAAPLAEGAGSVVVVGPSSSIDATLAEIGGVLAISLLGALGVGGLLIWWVTGRALAPVRRLADASHRMAAGDVAVRVPSNPGSDELAELGRSFNAMASRVQELLERQRMFVSDASHELRTPLTALIGSLDVLEHATDEDATRLRASMQQQLARLTRLVDDLMTLARLDSLGGGALRREPCDLALIARDVVAEARHLPGSSTIEVQLEAPTPVITSGDRDALHRVLLNLVANALHHGNGSPVRISVGRDGPWARVVVRDRGPGVAPGDLTAVFERFHRSPAAHDGASPGTGLGLAIARAVVEGHGGQISVHNDGGAVFVVLLPA